MKHPNRRQFTTTVGALLFLAGTPLQAEKFTMAVVSDTQNYSDVTLPQPRGVDTFMQEMQYLADKREEKNLVFVSFVGDIVQHGDGQFRLKDDTGTSGQFRYWDTRDEWDNANRAISILGRSSIPFGVVPGNHDYDSAVWWGGPGSPGVATPRRGGRTWNYYFGPQSRYFAGKPWYGGSFNQGLNSYQFFTAGGKRFLHISFEEAPPQAVLDWAQGIINANPGLPVIMTTHEWISPASTADKVKRSEWYRRGFEGSDHLGPDEVWDRFVRKNPEIFLILCGHLSTPAKNGMSQGENLRIDTNDAGYPVYQVLTDYQSNTVGPDGKAGSANGGAGWLRFIEFDTVQRKMHFYTYSALLNRYAGRDGYLPFGTRAGLSDFKLDFPPQLLK
jgi:hypothetical protein